MVSEPDDRRAAHRGARCHGGQRKGVGGPSALSLVLIGEVRTIFPLEVDPEVREYETKIKSAKITNEVYIHYYLNLNFTLCTP